MTSMEDESIPDVPGAGTTQIPSNVPSSVADSNTSGHVQIKVQMAKRKAEILVEDNAKDSESSDYSSNGIFKCKNEPHNGSKFLEYCGSSSRVKGYNYKEDHMIHFQYYNKHLGEWLKNEAKLLDKVYLKHKVKVPTERVKMVIRKMITAVTHYHKRGTYHGHLQHLENIGVREPNAKCFASQNKNDFKVILWAKKVDCESTTSDFGYFPCADPSPVSPAPSLHSPDPCPVVVPEAPASPSLEQPAVERMASPEVHTTHSPGMAPEEEEPVVLPQPPGHHMQTRSKSGISKRKVGFASSATTSLVPKKKMMKSNSDSSTSDPTSFTEASKLPQWQCAMTEEIASLTQQHTWSLVPKPPNANVVNGFEDRDQKAPQLSPSSLKENSKDYALDKESTIHGIHVDGGKGKAST